MESVADDVIFEIEDEGLAGDGLEEALDWCWRIVVGCVDAYAFVGLVECDFVGVGGIVIGF